MIGMIEWFGDQLHLLEDVTQEVVLSFDLTDTKVHAQAQRLHGGRAGELAIERAVGN